MKKLLIALAIVAMIVSGVFAINVGTAKELDIDMADYGTTVIITNNYRLLEMSDVLITYDSNSTNTITFDITLSSGVTYRLGSDSVTTATYSDARDLIPVASKMAETWLITTTETNVNLNVSFSTPE